MTQKFVSHIPPQVNSAGVQVESAYENTRNATYADLYKRIIRKCYGVTDVIIGHHLVYENSAKDKDGFVITQVEEIPSADTLIFDHAVAKRLWPERWQEALTLLALEPVETRDELLKIMVDGNVPYWANGASTIDNWDR